MFESFVQMIQLKFSSLRKREFCCIVIGRSKPSESDIGPLRLWMLIQQIEKILLVAPIK